MIKKLLSVLVLVFALSGSVLAQQSMSDQQVLEYVKTGMQQGKDQRQIATELARRGVTQEQAKRVKKLYEQRYRILCAVTRHIPPMSESLPKRMQGQESSENAGIPMWMG